jgi:hypothetical protein
MTVAPQHPPVHGYEGQDPFEIIDSKWGRMERWRAISQATGELSALVELNAQVRSDSANLMARQDARDAQLNAREAALGARERQHAVNVTQFVDFVGKASVLFDKLHKMRADRQEEPVAHPPGEPGNGALPEPPLEGPGIVARDQDPSGEFLRLAAPVTLDQEEPGPEFAQPGEPKDEPEYRDPVGAGLDDIEEEEKHGD